MDEAKRIESIIDERIADIFQDITELINVDHGDTDFLIDDHCSDAKESLKLAVNAFIKLNRD